VQWREQLSLSFRLLEEKKVAAEEATAAGVEGGGAADGGGSGGESSARLSAAAATFAAAAAATLKHEVTWVSGGELLGVNLAGAAAGMVAPTLPALPAGEQTTTARSSDIAAGDMLLRVVRCRWRAVIWRRRFTRSARCRRSPQCRCAGAVPKAPLETPAGEAAFPPLYLHDIVFWDEKHSRSKISEHWRNQELF
jgi:hypothetical protein